MFIVIFMFLHLVLTRGSNVYKAEWSDTHKDYRGAMLLNESLFGKLMNYHYKGKYVSEATYPGLAKVVYSKTSDIPYLCTASCVSNRVFMTAARCIFGLTLQYTRIIYKGKRLTVSAFVFPANETKQQFDDIAFMVTNKEPQVQYSPMPLLKEKRNGSNWDWLPVYWYGWVKAVGYATERRSSYVPFDAEYKLTEVNTVLRTSNCRKVFSKDDRLKGMNAPCYFSCGYYEFVDKKEECDEYLGVEGAVLIHVRKAFEVMGVATWGLQSSIGDPTARLFPVGISPANGDAFDRDFKCAKYLAEDKVANTPGSYQAACDKLN